MKQFGYSAALVVLITLLAGCIFSPSSSGSDGLGGAKLVDSYTYTVQGDQILVTRINTIYECDSLNHLVTWKDTFSDAIGYFLQGDSLFLRPWTDSLDYGNAVVQFRQDYARLSGSGGLQGTWKSVGHSYKVLSGSLASSDKTFLDQEVASDRPNSNSYETLEIRISAGALSNYRDVQYAKRFLDDWNGVRLYDTVPDTLAPRFHYNISVAQVDQYTVRLTGETTHEVILISRYGDFSGSYSSNISGHAAIHIPAINEMQPPDCSDTTSDTTMDWIGAFYDDNAKPGLAKMALEKRALIPDGSQKHNLSPLFKTFPRRRP